MDKQTQSLPSDAKRRRHVVSRGIHFRNYDIFILQLKLKNIELIRM